MPAVKESLKNATKATANLKGKVKLVSRKIRKNPRFYRPKTRTYSRNPKVRKSLVTEKQIKLDNFRLVQVPVSTEASLKNMEKNTLVFICDLQADKKKIARAITERYNVKVMKVNTLITPNAQKKAFIKLDPNFDASELGSKLGIL